MTRNKQRKNRRRRGAAAVEFAFVAPAFLAILLGMTQVGSLLELQSQLSIAAREGARVGSTDRSMLPATSLTTNDRVVNEIRNYLSSRGYNPEKVQIQITDAETGKHLLDLDDVSNSGTLFHVGIRFPYSESGGFPFPGSHDITLQGNAVFRNAEVVPN